MKTTELDKAKLALQGLSSDIPAGTTTLPVGGQNVPVKNLIATLAGFVTAADAKATAKLAFHQAVAEVSQQAPVIRTLLTELGIALRAIFGRGNPVLVNFGVLPGSPGKASAEAKAAAVQKRAAKSKAKKQALANLDAAVPVDVPPVNAK